jgi:tRNA (guanine37-N1)-methyltransferase
VRIDIVSIFPDYLSPLALSLVGRARTTGILDLRVHDLRDWTTDRHRTVDDTPFGGGAGMVMRPDVWGTALDDLVVDARVAEHYGTRPGVRVSEYSIGDYVLNGGEAAALVLVEAVVRLLPGVVGNPESLVEESHGSAGLLEYPVYTKPPAWRELDVPEVLLSGHHGRVARWRRDQALARTAARRPDLLRLLDPAGLDRADRTALAELGWTVGGDGVGPSTDT